MNKEAIEFANNKIDELYKKLNESFLRESKSLLRLNRISNVLESGMNDTQKLDYIKNIMKAEEE